MTGGAGFIGSHVAAHFMREEGYRVSVVEQFGSRYFCQREICHEFVLADLRDRRLAEDAVRGAAVVLLFAADMGWYGLHLWE